MILIQSDQDLTKRRINYENHTKSLKLFVFSNTYYIFDKIIYREFH